MPVWRDGWLIFHPRVTCPNCGFEGREKKWSGKTYTLHCGRCGRIEMLDGPRKRLTVFCAGEEQYDHGQASKVRRGAGGVACGAS